MATSNPKEVMDRVVNSFKNLADLSDSDVQQKMANVRRVGQKLLLHKPRPGGEEGGRGVDSKIAEIQLYCLSL